MIGARRRITFIGRAFVPTKRSERGKQQPEFADAPLIGQDFDQTLPRPAHARKTSVERGVTRGQSRRRNRSRATARFTRTPETRGILLQQLFDGNAHGSGGIAGQPGSQEKCSGQGLSLIHI